MRFKEFKVLVESRGVTARSPGETYVSTSNPNDVLTFQSVVVIPDNAPAFETADEMLNAVSQVIPPGANKVEENASNQGTKAAIIVQVADAEGNPQYWVKYIKQVPPQGVHGLWPTLKGYKYGKAAKTENLPIKPTDIITDDSFRSAEDLAAQVKSAVAAQVQGTAYEALGQMMSTAVDLAMSGQVAPIAGAGEYATIIAKYGGEYLGPIAIVAGGVTKGDIAKMLKVNNLVSLEGSTISFPQDVANTLIDSTIRTPDGRDIGISTKMAKGGGAASSLAGVADQISDQIRKKYPNGSEVIDILGRWSAIEGPLEVARRYGIIDDDDVDAVLKLDRRSQNIEDVQSERVQKLMKAQPTDSFGGPDYRAFYHAMMAIVNNMVIKVNEDGQFVDALKAALNNNNYLQLLTDSRVSGKNLTLDYFGKYPAVFEGKPQLWNKTYYATGNKGRIGFKMK